MDKNADAFRTISEVAGELQLPQHVLRFWETRFPQIRPLKRARGRRYYRPRDIEVLRAIKHLLYGKGYTIKGVQRVLKEQGAGAITAAAADAARESGADFSFPAARETPPLPDSQLWEDEEIGNVPQTAGSAGMHPSAESRANPEFGDAARMTGAGSSWILALTTEDTGRLRAALAELVECGNILEAACRR